jgi:two-component system NtrC family response regulator
VVRSLALAAHRKLNLASLAGDLEVSRESLAELPAGHLVRRAEALCWIGLSSGDLGDLQEALQLATQARHEPLRRRLSQAVTEQKSQLPVELAVDQSRRLQVLEQLKEVTKVINRETDGDHLLRMVLDQAVEHTGAKRGFLILLKGKSMSIPVARNIQSTDIENPEFAVSSSVARSVAQDGKPYLASDATTDVRFKHASSISQLKLQSILCVPLRSYERIVGAIYLDDPHRVDRFSENDLTFVTDLSDQAAIALEKAHLLRANLERQKELEESKREIERLNRQLERTVAEQARELTEVKESLRATQEELSLKYEYPTVITRSTAMREVLRRIDRLTDSSYPVFLFGESGTGKELLARSLHTNGPRSRGPYFTFNCASVSPSLIETELFGHVKGSFTGADRDKPGIFELAHNGTLFLDEICDASLELQSKLLRATQFGEVLRVGSDEVRHVDVRVISASNRDLQVEVEEGRFRADLQYRLNVHRVELPPLRDRREDVELLIEHFQSKHTEKLGNQSVEIQPKAQQCLASYDWPGNVRELENVVIDLIVRCGSEGQVLETDLPEKIRVGPQGLEKKLIESKNLKNLVEGYERDLIEHALQRSQGNRKSAARDLGMSERNLYKKMHKYGLGGRDEEGVGRSS